MATESEDEKAEGPGASQPEAEFKPAELNKEQALKILKLDDNASFDDVRAAYKKRLRETHPDKNQGRQEEAKMVIAAHEFLTSDAVKPTLGKVMPPSYQEAVAGKTAPPSYAEATATKAPPPSYAEATATKAPPPSYAEATAGKAPPPSQPQTPTAAGPAPAPSTPNIGTPSPQGGQMNQMTGQGGDMSAMTQGAAGVDAGGMAPQGVGMETLKEGTQAFYDVNALVNKTIQLNNAIEARGLDPNDQNAKQQLANDPEIAQLMQEQNQLRAAAIKSVGKTAIKGTVEVAGAAVGEESGTLGAVTNQVLNVADQAGVTDQVVGTVNDEYGPMVDDMVTNQLAQMKSDLPPEAQHGLDATAAGAVAAKSAAANDTAGAMKYGAEAAGSGTQLAGGQGPAYAQKPEAVATTPPTTAPPAAEPTTAAPTMAESEGAAPSTEPKYEFKPGELNKEQALKILGLDESATYQDVRSAYKKRMLETHPDKVKGKEEENKAVVAANELLSSDEVKSTLGKAPPQTVKDSAPTTATKPEATAPTTAEPTAATATPPTTAPTTAAPAEPAPLAAENTAQGPAVEAPTSGTSAPEVSEPAAEGPPDVKPIIKAAIGDEATKKEAKESLEKTMKEMNEKMPENPGEALGQLMMQLFSAALDSVFAVVGPKIEINLKPLIPSGLSPVAALFGSKSEAKTEAKMTDEGPTVSAAAKVPGLDLAAGLGGVAASLSTGSTSPEASLSAQASTPTTPSFELPAEDEVEPLFSATAALPVLSLDKAEKAVAAIEAGDLDGTPDVPGGDLDGTPDAPGNMEEPTPEPGNTFDPELLGMLSRLTDTLKEGAEKPLEIDAALTAGGATVTTSSDAQMEVAAKANLKAPKPEPGAEVEEADAKQKQKAGSSHK